jgi:hypothetical protein
MQPRKGLYFYGGYMSILMIIVLVLVGALLVIGTLQLRAAINAFDMLIIKFTGINQQFYENQKIITQRTSDILKILENETINNKNISADLCRTAQEQIKYVTETYSIVKKLNADILHGTDMKKIIQLISVQKSDKK